MAVKDSRFAVMKVRVREEGWFVAMMEEPGFDAEVHCAGKRKMICVNSVVTNLKGGKVYEQ